MMFTIGEFVALTGVSAKKLRHYDAIGLFRPAWVDPRSSYRYYLATQIPQLQRIVALRDLGIPLATIARLVDGGDSLEEELRRRRRDPRRRRPRPRTAGGESRRLLADDVRGRVRHGDGHHQSGGACFPPGTVCAFALCEDPVHAATFGCRTHLRLPAR